MKVFLNRGLFPVQNVAITIGGSKSESNRLLLLQAQFSQISIENLSDSDDTAVLQHGLKTENPTVNVHHAGTAMRFLTAYFATKKGTQRILTGSARMQQRPIGPLVNALRSLGAEIEYLNNEGFPPLKITGKSLQKKEVTINAEISSQYISALMLVAPTLPNGLTIHLEGKATSAPYIEMTLSLLKKVDISGSFSGKTISISRADNPLQTRVLVESDWSSASYFYSLTALSENLEITLSSFSEESLQGDSRLVQMYSILGVKTVFNNREGTISLSKSAVELPHCLKLDLSDTPDLAQTLAVSCFGLGIGCKLSGLHTLRIKETDRLRALKTELEKLGAKITVDNDSLIMEKPEGIHPNICVESYDDHRMAMAFAPLCLKTNLAINDASVVSKSYPNFWEDLQKLGIGCVFQ